LLLPRVRGRGGVVSLAHHALLAAALARAKVVTAEHVQAALAEVS
jgi:hypothetical protein